MTLLDTRSNWIDACPASTLIPGRGAAVLMPNGTQAAVFLLPDGSVHALCNIDPFNGAAVLSRGIVGDRLGEPTVASPLLKQVFSLRTGQCLDRDGLGVTVYDARIVDTGTQQAMVQIGPVRARWT
ncbi:MAG: nitrite reductase small subunit NirD [Actinomycetota bacterium]|nr:nitrite reductase small subunit NirD [Actinomycetota bacterium]